jgi:16S rRNA (uracil1498-N3)-methyltransferase
MKNRRFFANQGLNERGETIISGDEHYHIRNVLRYRDNEKIELFDGKGNLFRGRIVKSDNDCTTVGIKESLFEEKPEVKLIVATSILKRKAMFALIENLSEVGVDEIRPVIFSRTDVEYKQKNVDKWEKLAIMSLKVNGKLWPSRIFPPRSFKDFIDFSRGVENKITMDLEGERDFSVNKKPPFLVVIGPPGDFTSGERKTLVESGFRSIRINDCILRSEVAALSVSAILKAHL